MYEKLIDAHIHLDMYRAVERERMLQELAESGVEGLIAVSNNLASSREQLRLARQDNRIKPAVGYHPEQPLPSEEELQSIVSLIDQNHHELTAIGEVGLPYYTRQEQPALQQTPYIELLEQFIRKAGQYELPVALHAVYEDAATVCRLLEVHSIKAAHFHWFKGDHAILERILANGYAVSVTPEVTYRKKIRRIVEQTPLSQLMVETDGPWPYAEEFSGKMTHPVMMHSSICAIAQIKRLERDEVYREIYKTTKQFYRIT